MMSKLWMLGLLIFMAREEGAGDATQEDIENAKKIISKLEELLSLAREKKIKNLEKIEKVYENIYKKYEKKDYSKVVLEGNKLITLIEKAGVTRGEKAEKKGAVSESEAREMYNNCMKKYSYMSENSIAGHEKIAQKLTEVEQHLNNGNFDEAYSLSEVLLKSETVLIEEYEKAKSVIEDLKKFSAELPEYIKDDISKNIAILKQLMDAGDYKEVIRQCGELQADAKQAEHYYNQIKNEEKKIEGVVEIFYERREEVPYLDTRKKIAILMEERRYEEALGLATSYCYALQSYLTEGSQALLEFDTLFKDTQNYFDSTETYFRTHLEYIKSKLEEAAGFGVSVEDAQNLVVDAEKFWKEKKYAEAFDNVLLAKSYIFSAMETRLNTLISEIETFITTETGLSQEVIENYKLQVENAKQQIASKNYTGAKEVLDKLKGEFQSIRNNIIENMRIEVEKKIEVAEKMGIEVPGVRRLLSIAEHELAKENFANAKMHYKNAIEGLNAVVLVEVEKKLSDAEKYEKLLGELPESKYVLKIEDLKKRKASEDAIKLIHEVTMLENLFVEDMNTLIGRKMDEIHKVTPLLKSMGIEYAPEIPRCTGYADAEACSNKMDEIRRTINEMLRKKFDNMTDEAQKKLDQVIPDIDISKERALLEEYLKMISQEQWAEAYELHRQFISSIEDNVLSFIRRYVREVIRPLNDTARSFGLSALSSKEIGALLKNLTLENAKAIYENTVAIEGNLTNQIRAFIKDKTEKIMSGIQIAESIGFDVAFIKEDLAKIEEMENQKKFEEANAALEEVKKKMANALTDFVRKEVNGVKSLVNFAIEKNIDVGSAQVCINDAETLIGRKDLVRAHEKITEAHETLIGAFESAIREMKETLNMVVYALHKVDVDTTEILEKVKPVDTLIDNKKLMEAIDLLYSVIDEATDILAARWNELYRNTEETVSYLERYGLEEQLRQNLEKARTLYSTNRMYEAIIELCTLLFYGNNKITNEAKKTLEELAGMLDTGKEYGIEWKGDMQNIASAREMIEQSRYLEALELISPIHRDYVNSIKTYLAGIQTSIHEGLTVLKEMGFDTTKLAEQVTDIQSYIDANNWKNALAEATKLRNKIQELSRTRIAEIIKDNNTKIKLLEEHGEDVSKLKFMQEVAQEKLAQNDLPKARSAALSAKEAIDRMLLDKIRGFAEYWETILTLIEKHTTFPQLFEKIKLLEEKMNAPSIDVFEIDHELRAMLKNWLHTKNRENLTKFDELKKEYGNVKLEWEKTQEYIEAQFAKERFEVIDIQNILTFQQSVIQEIKIRISKLAVEFEKILYMIDSTEKQQLFKDKIAKCRDHLNADEVMLANRILKEINEELQKVIAQNIEQKMSDANKIIDLMKVLSIPYHNYETRYLEAKEALTKEEYARAFENLAYIIEQGNREITGYLKNIDDEITAACETMKKLEIDITTILEAHNKARELQRNNDIENAAKVYEKLKSEITKTMEDTLINLINQCDLITEFALGLGIDVSQPKELLNKGKIRFASKMYVQARNLVSKALTISENAVTKYISDEIALIGPQIEMVKLLGIPETEYSNALTEATKKLESKDYMGAQSIAVKLKKEVEEILEENSTKLLREIRSTVEKATQIGADTTVFERMYFTAQSFVNARNYDGIVKIAKDAQLKLIEVVNETFKNNLETFAKWLDILAMFGIDGANYVEIRQMAKNAFEAGNPIEGATIIKNALNDMEISVKDAALKQSDEIQKKVNTLKKYGCQTAPVELELKNISENIEKRDYIEVKEHRENANKMLDKIASAKAKELLQTTKNYLADLRKIGVDIADRSPEIEVFISGSRYFDAIEKYEEIIAEADERYAQRIINLIEETEKYIQTCTELIGPADNFIESAKYVRELVNNKKYSEAYQIAEQLRVHVVSQIEGKITAVINEAQSFIERFKAIGPDILSVAIILNNASLSLSQKKYVEAYQLGKSAIEKTMNAVREHTSKEIEDYKIFISDCERIGIDVSKFREGVARAERFLNENMVIDTYYAIKETKKLGEESMATYLKSKVNDVIATIDLAERLGVDTGIVVNLKNRLLSAQKSPNVLDALRELKNIEEDAIEASREKVKLQWNDINELYQFFSGAGLTIPNVEELLKTAEQQMQSNKFVETMATLIECESMIVERVETKVSSEISKWRALIASIVKVNPELESLNENLRKVNDLMIVKEYRKAYSMVNELENTIRNNIENKIIPLMKNKLVQISKIKEVGLDTSKVEAEIMDAVEKGSTGKYIESIELFENAVTYFDKMLVENTNRELEAFTKDLEIAEELGCADVSKYKQNLAGVKNTVSEGKFAEALAKILSYRKELSDKLNEKLTRMITECIDEMDLASDLNIDFSEARAHIETARMKMKYLDIMGAYSIIAKVKSLIPEIIKNQIAGEIASNIEKSERLKAAGIDVSMHVHLLHKARERLNAQKYSEAKFLIVRYLNSISPILEENFDKSVAMLKNTINTAKTMGLVPKDENKLWAEVKKYVGMGDYITVNDIIDTYHRALISLIEDTIKDELQKLSSLLAIGHNYKCPLGDIPTEFNNAQSDFQNKKYSSALRITKECINRLEQILTEKAELDISNISGDIREYARFKVDTSIPEKILEDAKKKLHDRNYSLAFESITHARKTLEQDVINFEKELIDAIESLVRDAAEMKINIERAFTLFSNGKELFNNGKLLDAIRSLTAAKDDMTQTIKGELKQRIETMNASIEVGKEMKIDISDVEQYLQNATKSLLINSFKEAQAYLSQATSRFIGVATTSLGVEISKLEALINVGENIGCNLIQAKKDVLKAKEMVVNKEFTGAKKHIDTTFTKVRKIVSEKVLNGIAGAEEILEMAKEFGIDTTRQREILKNARELEQKEKYQEAHNQAIETKAYLVNSIVKFINSEISNETALYNLCVSIGIPELASAKVEIDESLKKLHEMNFKEAYSRIKNARQIIVKNSSEYLSALLKDAENILADAKSIDAVVSEELYAELDNSRNLITQQRYKDARENILKVYETGLHLAQNKMQEKMNSLNELLEISKKLGVPVEGAQDLINEIMSNIGTKNFKNANKRCLELMKRVTDLLHSYCENQIMNTAKLIDLGESIGVKALEIKKEVESTWALLRNKQYIDVVNVTNNAQDKIRSMLDTFVKEQIQQIQNETKYAESIGAGVLKVKDMFASAVAKYTEKDYPTAHRILRDTEDTLAKILTRHINDSVNVARLTYDIGSRVDVDLSETDAKFKEIETLVKDKKFREAYQNVVETRKYIISKIETHMTDIMNAVNQKIEIAAELGVDITNTKAMFSVASDTLKQKDYLGAKKLFAKVEENVDTLCRNYLQEEYTNIMKKIEEFKTQGVDVSDVLSAVEKVKSRIDKKLYVEAKLALETTRAKMRTLERIAKLGV